MAELERETYEIREIESQPSVACGGRWRRLRFGCMKLGHQHSICSAVGLISCSLSLPLSLMNTSVCGLLIFCWFDCCCVRST